MSVRELADIDESRIELINEFEVKVTEYRKATSDLMRPPSSLLIPTHCLEFLRLSLFAFSHRCIGVIFNDCCNNLCSI
jgi:hypothetical protein